MIYDFYQLCKFSCDLHLLPFLNIFTMKKIILAAGLVLGTVVCGFSQQEKNQDNFKKWQVRARVLAVVPQESASIDAIGGDVTISNAYIPEVDFTYFFTENLGAELILGTTKHDVGAIETAVGNIDLGSVRLLPPTLTFQYHFNGELVRPYIGAGLNYTIFYDSKSGNVVDDVSYDGALGYAFQAGFDFDLNDNFLINVDVKKLYLNTDVTVDATTALGATVGADVDINPFIFGVGIGYKF